MPEILVMDTVESPFRTIHPMVKTLIGLVELSTDLAIEVMRDTVSSGSYFAALVIAEDDSCVITKDGKVTPLGLGDWIGLPTVFDFTPEALAVFYGVEDK